MHAATTHFEEVRMKAWKKADKVKRKKEEKENPKEKKKAKGGGGSGGIEAGHHASCF